VFCRRFCYMKEAAVDAGSIFMSFV
jgi:hypothetical protein